MPVPVNQPTKPDPYSWVDKSTIDLLNANKITDPQAQKNLIWTVQAETKGKPVRENLFYKTPERIVDVFGKNKLFAGLSRKDAIQKAIDLDLVKNPENLGNAVYGGRMGNTDEGDGYKYRGGAAIGITGKNNWLSVFKAMGLPQDTDPDVITKDPKLSMQASLAFIGLNSKGKDLSDINQVNKIVRPAVSYEERLKNNPFPDDSVLDRAKNPPPPPPNTQEQKTSSFDFSNAFNPMSLLSKDSFGNNTLDTRPSDV